MKLRIKRHNAAIVFSDQGRKDICHLHDQTLAYVELVNDGVRKNHTEILSKAKSQGDAITHFMKESRARHLGQVEQRHVSASASLVFTDILNAYRRIKDHSLNIAEALAGEK